MLRYVECILLPKFPILKLTFVVVVIIMATGAGCTPSRTSNDEIQVTQPQASEPRVQPDEMRIGETENQIRGLLRDDKPVEDKSTLELPSPGELVISEIGTSEGDGAAQKVDQADDIIQTPQSAKRETSSVERPSPTKLVISEIGTSEVNAAAEKVDQAEDIIQTPQSAEEETSSNPSDVSGVLVETSKQEYRQDEGIVVTIRNDLHTRIVTFDQQAFCSIIRLEQQIETEWREVRNCFSTVPPSSVTLKPRTETIAKIPGISPGIYRAIIVYSVGETFDFGRSSVGSSPPFSVQ